MNTMIKTSPFYLLYGQQLHLLRVCNVALPIDAETGPFGERLKQLQSSRKEAVMATYEQAYNDKIT